MSFPKLTLHSGDMISRIEIDSRGWVTVVRKVQPNKPELPEAMIRILLEPTDLALLGAFATAVAQQEREES